MVVQWYQSIKVDLTQSKKSTFIRKGEYFQIKISQNFAFLKEFLYFGKAIYIFNLPSILKITDFDDICAEETSVYTFYVEKSEV